MSNDNCKNFEECNAPLCPLDEESLKYCIWYPDEDICNLRRFQTLDWIKKQKLVARKHGSTDGFFNIRMLNTITHIQKGIAGANPDLPLSAKSDEKWIAERLGRAIKRSGSLKKNVTSAMG